MLKLPEISSGLAVQWLGNDGWLLYDGKRLIATDPDLFNPERLIPPPVAPAELADRLSAVFISHEHEDHFNGESCRVLAEEGNCLFVVPESCVRKAASLRLPGNRLRLVHPGERMESPGLRVECVRAIHGHIGGSVYSGASLRDCGYRFTFGGKTIYQPGDTLLLEEHFTMGQVDLLFVSPTEHNTGVENSQKLIELLKPRYIFPQHYGTYGEAPDNYFWTHGYVKELYGALTPERQASWRQPGQGEWVLLP